MILISAVIFPVSHAIAAFHLKILILHYVTLFHVLKIYNLQEALKKFILKNSQGAEKISLVM